MSTFPGIVRKCALHGSPVPAAQGGGAVDAAEPHSAGGRNGLVLFYRTDRTGTPSPGSPSDKPGGVCLPCAAGRRTRDLGFAPAKMFKQVYGVPVYHYIKEYRLEQAAVELVRSAKPITQIAQNAGYDNASKFSEAFRKRYGTTPSQYRTHANGLAKRSREIRME